MSAPRRNDPSDSGPTIWTLGLKGRKPEELVARLKASGAELVVDVRFNPNYPVSRNRRSVAALAEAAGLSYEWRKGLGNRLHKVGGYELEEPDQVDALEAEIRAGRRIVLLCQCKCVRHCAKIEAPGRKHEIVCAPECAKECECEAKCHRYVLIADRLLERTPRLRIIDL